MSHPNPYPSPHPLPGHQQPLASPRRGVSTIDVVVTSIVSLMLLALAFLSFFWSLFAMMATDGCGTPGRCNDGLILSAYLVGWGGLGAALLLPLIGIPIAAVKRKMMWIWPTAGVVLLVVAMGGGAAMLKAGVGG